MTDFSGQVVVITGAAGNLGKATSAAFISRGARTALIARSRDRLEEAYSPLTVEPDHLLISDVDLTDESDVVGAITQISNRFSTIDVLVNITGGYKAGDLVEDTSLDTWNFMLDLNAKTVFLMSRAIIPIMKQKRFGKIINIAALAAISGKARMAAYIVSKDAVIRLTESMAEELRPFNVQVNAILPQSIDTPENRAQTPNVDPSRWIKPEEIAEVICFLASPGMRIISGASIPVRG